MSQTLTDNPASWVSQTAPVAGEPRTDTSVVDPFQRSANRTAYLKAFRDFVNGPNAFSGIRQLMWTGSLATLKAIAAVNRVDGQIIYRSGYGLYQFNASSTDDATPEPRVLRPDDVAPGAPGRWVWDKSAASGLNGIASLNGAGKIEGTTLAIANPAGRVLAANVVNGHTLLAFASLNAINYTTSSGTELPVTGSDVIVQGQVGDVCAVSYELKLSGADYMYIRTTMEEERLVTGYAFIANSSPLRQVDVTSIGQIATVTARFNIVSSGFGVTGNYRVRLSAKASGLGSNVNVSNVTYEAKVTRP